MSNTIVSQPYDGEDVQDTIDPTLLPPSDWRAGYTKQWIRAGMPGAGVTEEDASAARAAAEH
jgi:hypothetical protein